MIKRLLPIFLIILLSPLMAAGQNCEIAQVNATALNCTNYSFFVSVNLVVNNPSSPGFTLAGNGMIYGTFLYSDLPVTVGPLLGDSLSQYEFIAWDVNNPQCQNYTTLPAADCGPICHLSNLNIHLLQCITSSIASVEINFDHENVTGPSFDLYNDHGVLIASALYSSLPYLITNFTVNGASPITVTVCDHNNSVCCETFTVDAIDCNPNNCEIFNITADPECIHGNFVVHLDFDTDNPASDSFSVHGNSLNYGSFAYHQLPIILGPLNGNSNINWEFIIQDVHLPSCTGDKLLGVYHCPPPCAISSLTADPTLCNGNDAYYLDVDMDFEGQGHGGFSLFSESHYYGTYAYNDLPVTIPEFAVTGNILDQADQITVCDNEHPGCCATTAFMALPCNGCIIYNLVATPLPCNGNNEIYVSIDFDFQNVSSEGFSVSGDGNIYGNYSYAEVPVLVGPFPGDSSNYLEFVITDLVNEFCLDATEIGYLPCDSICELSGLEVQTGACTGNNMYILQLNFSHSGMNGISFDLSLNGEFYSTFDYSDLPLTLLEFPSNSAGPDTISVCDHLHQGCCTSLVFDSPNCECSVYETTTQTIGCTSDSTFAISVEYYTQNFPGNLIDVSLDGILLGVFNISQIPLILDSIPEGNGSAVLTICAHEVGSCCDNVLIQLMNCDGPVCNISNLLAENGGCNSDSTYLLDVVFNHLFLPSDSVNIWANDLFIGKFFVPGDSVRIEHFPVVAGDSTTVTVCAVGNNSCCDAYTIATPHCEFGGCIISNLVALPGECLADSTYALDIEYNRMNIPGDSVTVTGNGNLIGSYIDPNGHILIEHFPVYDAIQTVLTVCSVAYPDCCASYEFETPNCDSFICSIEINFVQHGPCQPDSTVALIVDFHYNQLPTDSVTISANDVTIGTFQVQEGHIVIDSFPVFNSNSTLINICAVGDSSCCAVYDFETPNCGACSIFDLMAEPDTCTSDSTFLLNIIFHWNNLPTDSVLIYANDHFIGKFHTNPDFISIDHFPVLNGVTTNLEVCALGAPDCCADYSFITPLCDTTIQCNIYDISVQHSPCNSDSTFGVVINFQYQHILANGFDVYTGNTYLGFFNFEQIPIQTNDFPSNVSGNYIVTICEHDNFDCCNNFEFEGPVCGGLCDIYDLRDSLSYCDSAGHFSFFLDFLFHNVGHSGFNVVGNGTEYGNFSYDQLPVEIGSFETDNTVYEFLVTDAENPACFAYLEPGIVNCIFVATNNVEQDEIFQLLNNGSLPAILVKKDLFLSLFNSNGKMMAHHKAITAGTFYELNSMPSGFYIATIESEGKIWPVKMVKCAD